MVAPAADPKTVAGIKEEEEREMGGQFGNRKEEKWCRRRIWLKLQVWPSPVSTILHFSIFPFSPSSCMQQEQHEELLQEGGREREEGKEIIKES